MKSQGDASGNVSQHAGRDLLSDRGIFGSSGANSGIPASYGAATGSANSNPNLPSAPTPAPCDSTEMPFMATEPPSDVRDDAVPAICTSGDLIGMVGEALNPTTQSLGELLDAYASIHVHEDGRNPMTQSPGNTHVCAPHTPQGVPEAEEAPACSERGTDNELSVIIQQLLKMMEAAVNPAQGTPPHPRSGGVTINCLLPSDNRAQLAGLITDAFLVSVDVFQQEGKFPAAITLMAKVSDASVGSQSAHT